LLALIVLVTAAHLAVRSYFSSLIDAWQTPASTPARMKAAYVRLMQLKPRAATHAATPPPPKPHPTPRRIPRLARAVPSPASSPPPPASEPEQAASEPPAASAPPSEAEALAASVPEPAASTASPSGPDALAQAASSAVAGASDAGAPGGAAFRWPQAVRLEYTLNGQYRGKLSGTGVVEWIREANHYQVHLDINIGPAFAPLLSWSGSSDGRITPEGLRPQRYDETQGGMLSRDKSRHVVMGDDEVEFSDGHSAPRPDALQDQTSQFIQMAYVFRTQPSLFVPGQVIDMALARPGRIYPVAYNVIGEEDLDLPVGHVSAMHLRPRRREDTGSDGLDVEVWYSAQLEYLPVRIHLKRGDYDIDLVLSRLPQVGEVGPDGQPLPTQPK
jgi:hypothetical protein